MSDTKTIGEWLQSQFGSAITYDGLSAVYITATLYAEIPSFILTPFYESAMRAEKRIAQLEAQLSGIETALERLVDVCDTGFMANDCAVIAAEAALQRLYLMRKTPKGETP